MIELSQVDSSELLSLTDIDKFNQYKYRSLQSGFCSEFYAEISDKSVTISFGIDQSYFDGSDSDCGVLSLDATVQLQEFLNMFEVIKNSIPSYVMKLAESQA